jgi:hypothetical protein
MKVNAFSTLKDLRATRQKLVLLLADAEAIHARDKHELQTVKRAIVVIDELIVGHKDTSKKAS